ncbi:dihydroxyacetone kinase subunit DhaL [Streptomyces zingiberis]|uniref:Dihydroxyacetone kinase subunit L n=1 Tax=Streptomyces zingiberis TaxID=2053010 RepID=A0ABX1BV39_9ACTN|nr:dihydroxyacetone kinase subunit DhaL [Streptomyces zingiberis]NJQ01591.1 dihydroxyacetone kinase subunit L [Streptomyces zingiberis]
MTSSTVFDRAFTDAWIRRFAASVAATQQELTALDQAAGDGDFGSNLGSGLTSSLRLLDEAPDGDPADASVPLTVTATAFLDSVGGTSGPMFGLLFQRMATAVQEAGPALTTAALSTGTRDGLEVIQRVGEATEGDKTLVDALAPAAEALGGCAADVLPDAALALAAEGAWVGVRNTALLRARRGRASYIGDRASGVPDPGAVGIGLLFASARGGVSELRPLLAELPPHEPV